MEQYLYVEELKVEKCPGISAIQIDLGTSVAHVLLTCISTTTTVLQSMEPVPVEELNVEKCPRISAIR